VKSEGLKTRNATLLALAVFLAVAVVAASSSPVFAQYAPCQGYSYNGGSCYNPYGNCQGNYNNGYYNSGSNCYSPGYSSPYNNPYNPYSNCQSGYYNNGYYYTGSNCYGPSYNNNYYNNNYYGNGYYGNGYGNGYNRWHHRHW